MTYWPYNPLISSLSIDKASFLSPTGKEAVKIYGHLLMWLVHRYNNVSLRYGKIPNAISEMLVLSAWIRKLISNREKNADRCNNKTNILFFKKQKAILFRGKQEKLIIDVKRMTNQNKILSLVANSHVYPTLGFVIKHHLNLSLFESVECEPNHQRGMMIYINRLFNKKNLRKIQCFFMTVAQYKRFFLLTFYFYLRCPFVLCIYILFGK